MQDSVDGGSVFASCVLMMSLQDLERERVRYVETQKMLSELGSQVYPRASVLANPTSLSS